MTGGLKRQMRKRRLKRCRKKLVRMWRHRKEERFRRSAKGFHRAKRICLWGSFLVLGLFLFVWQKEKNGGMLHYTVLQEKQLLESVPPEETKTFWQGVGVEYKDGTLFLFQVEEQYEQSFEDENSTEKGSQGSD